MLQVLENQENYMDQLREMIYGGTSSAAMIYYDRPIFDHFRYV